MSPAKYDFLIGRQPIVDRDSSIQAYELLFRHAQGQAAESFGSTAASNRIIVDSLLEHGLDRLVGRQRAFINFTRDNLLSGTALLLPRGKVVIEVLETVEIDAALIDAVRDLAARGYAIALDDFVFDPEWLPLVDCAELVKIDVRTTTPAAVREVMASLSNRPVRFLAEKVETQAEFEAYRDLGCAYFQGYHFSKPQIVRGTRLETSQMAVLQLLARINEPNITLDELARTISLDLGLSYKLLRYLNSAFLALPVKVDSLRMAIAYMGLEAIRRWASLVILAGFPEKRPELFNATLVRAHMCESLAELAGLRNAGQFFLVGLLSGIGQIMRCPLEEVVSGLPLSQPLKDALVQHRGPAGEALTSTLAYEAFQLEDVGFANLPVAEIGRLYLESVAWAYETGAGLAAAG